jgi:DNA-binding NarL/FixJ family response regulator
MLLIDSDLGPLHSAEVIVERAIQADIIVAGFTASHDLIEQAAFLERGAAVVVGKGCGPADLVAVVELGLAGEDLMSADERHAALARLRKHRAEQQQTMVLFNTLTGRERETLCLIAEGHGAAEIAGIWEVTLPTVRSHIRAVLAKLGLTSQLQAAAVARDSGWYEAASTGPGSSILTMPNVAETGTIARRSGSRR